MSRTQVNLTLPAYNEAKHLAESVARLLEYLRDGVPFDWRIVIADNGSTDGTLGLAQQLAREHPQVQVVHLPEKGRGGALKQVWLTQESDVLSYMDVDLSSEPGFFPALVEPLARGQCDLATGSRLLPASRTTRCWKRELISRGYNRLVRAVCHTGFSDAQCGFKAITRRAARELLPLVEDPGWFFDTELLVLAEKLGYRLFELPVTWVEAPDSHVRLLRTALGDLRGLLRVRRRLARGLGPAESGRAWGRRCPR
jgi:glycosyltransferase involved in cell wall biosynthesis